jgi:hypothetical protein
MIYNTKFYRNPSNTFGNEIQENRVTTFLYRSSLCIPFDQKVKQFATTFTVNHRNILQNLTLTKQEGPFEGNPNQ